MVCDSLAVCQCLRTWIALDVRISRAVAWVFESICKEQISGELSPRSGIILSHLRSDKFLKIGTSPALVAGSGDCARVCVSATIATARKTQTENFAFIAKSIDPSLHIHKRLSFRRPLDPGSLIPAMRIEFRYDNASHGIARCCV